MRQILFFDSMLTPKMITLIYWISLLAILFYCVSGVLGVAQVNEESSKEILVILGSAIGSAISLRIFCELLIVIFKINESLQEVCHGSSLGNSSSAAIANTKPAGNVDSGRNYEKRDGHKFCLDCGTQFNESLMRCPNCAASS